MPDEEQDHKQAPAAEAPSDDLRDKFRAALERKHGRGADGAGGSGASGGDPNSKASARTSNSKRQREFRRKSGG